MGGRKAPKGVKPKAMTEYSDEEDRYPDGQPQDHSGSESEASQAESFFPEPRSRYSSSGESRSRHKSKSRSQSHDRLREKSRKSQPEFSFEDENLGVLSQESAQHRQNRRVASAHKEMSGGRRSQANRGPKTAEQLMIEKLQAKKAALEKENQGMKTELQTAKQPKKRGKGGAYVATIPLNQDLYDKIKTASGAQGPSLWRTTKFLNTDKDIRTSLMTVMADLPECRPFLQGDPGKVEENINAFKATYGGAVSGGINDQRNNSQTGLKLAYLTRYDAGKKMPDPNQLLKVIYREDLAWPEKPPEPTEGDFPNEPSKYAQAKKVYETRLKTYRTKKAEVKDNRDFFKWYWTCLLPKICGNKRWGLTIRNYGTISQHHYPGDENKHYVTTSDEALVQILYENCGQRFPYLARLDKRKFTKEELRVVAEHPEYQSAYSDAKSGQASFGGWDAESRSRFSHLIAHFREVRRDPKTHALEEEILKEIRAEMGIDKGQDKKRKAVPVHDLSKTEGIEYVCCKSDAYDSEDEVLKKQKLIEIAPFVPKYRPVPTKGPRKVKGKPKRGDEDEEAEEESGDEEE